jgi:UDP-N-acetylmuramate--alanine ligase
MTHIHLIGIGGTGLSAIARLLLEMGHTVTGSDRVDSPFVQDLRSAGVTISIGHSPENVRGADLVVRSSAILDDNPEVTAARSLGIPVLKRADFLGSLMEGKTAVAVAGTHGKTTTTSMIAWILSTLGQDPSFIVGGVLANLGVNAHAGKGQTFIIEADEYDRMFLGLKPSIEVITSVEHDHPDCYPTPADFQAAFVEFVSLLPPHGTLVYCAEDAGARHVAARAKFAGRRTISYGWSGKHSVFSAEYAVTKDEHTNPEGGYTFTAIINGQPATVALSVPGKQNVLNALAALTVASVLGLDIKDAARALGEFKGTRRRFEVRGEANGVTVIDDYAHHPTEIRATLSGARSRYPGRRIWAVWQPHTYSRTRTLLSGFAAAFPDADAVIVTEVYKAREPEQDFSAVEVVREMSHPAVQFIAGLPEVSNYLVSHLSPGDVLLVLSAGDADQVSTEVLARLKGTGSNSISR